MKFRYDLRNNYFKIFNESQGIVNFRKEIEKDLFSIDTYLNKCKSYVFLTLFIFVITLIFNFIDNDSLFTNILWILFALMVGMVTVIISLFFVSYHDQKKLPHSGEIQFSKTGIMDISDSGLKIGMDWSLVDYAVVTDTIIVILSKTNMYFHFSEDLIDDVLIAISKYQPNLKVMDASISRYREQVFKDLEKKNKEEEKLKEQEEKQNKKKIGKSKTVKDIKEINIEEDTITELKVPAYEEYKDEESIL